MGVNDPEGKDEALVVRTDQVAGKEGQEVCKESFPGDCYGVTNRGWSGFGLLVELLPEEQRDLKVMQEIEAWLSLGES